jgi:putative phosphoribosyl transferase
MDMDWMLGYGASRYRDRRDAGRQLAERLLDYRGRPDVLVLALPRGGVPVGFEVARALEAPLDVLVVRKLGLPGNEELAMGAIASGGVRVLNPDAIEQLRIPEAVIERAAAQEQLELERREELFRGGRAGIDPAGCTVILVDDGLATGATMKAAIQALRQRHPAEIVVAVPVAPAQTCREMADLADRAVCLLQPTMFGGVGEWYLDFRQTSDGEVRSLLEPAQTDPRRAALVGGGK